MVFSIRFFNSKTKPKFKNPFHKVFSIPKRRRITVVRMHAIDLLVRVRSAARNQVVKREVRKGKLKREVMVIFLNIFRKLGAVLEGYDFEDPQNDLANAFKALPSAPPAPWAVSSIIYILII